MIDSAIVLDRRTALKLSQQRLAELSGVHRGTIRNIEVGRPATRHTLKVISDALDAYEKEQGVVTAAVERARRTVSTTAEVAAIATIVDVLGDLSPDEQRRALNYINERFGGES